jgi:membrane protein
MFKSMSLGGLNWKVLAQRVWAETSDDDVLGRSAQLAYYFLLALFPALLFLTSLIGYIAGESGDMRNSLFGYLSAVLPGEATKIVQTTVAEVTQNSGGGKFSFGVLATLWAASNGMGAISESLNVAYDVKETRPWWKTRLIAVGLTMALALLILTSLVLVLYGHDIAEWVAGAFGLGQVFEVAWKVIQWPIVLAAVTLGFALIYYFAPDTQNQHWKWLTPGAVIGVVLWLLVSFAFKAYLSYFNSYSATYGSLGAVIILMLWFYFTGTAILIGGEINSEIEHEMARQGDPEAKEKGEKAPGAAKQPPTKSEQRGEPKKKTAKAEGEGARARTAHGRVTRLEGGADSSARERRPFSLGKLAVVLGAWAVSKLGRGERKTR